MKRLLQILALVLTFVPVLIPATVLLNGQPAAVTKTPYEQFLWSVDFTQALNGDAFTLVSVTSTNRSNKQDTTAQIIAASPAPAILGGTNKIIFAIKGGVSGQTHIASVRVNDTTTGDKFEGLVTVVVN